MNRTTIRIASLSFSLGLLACPASTTPDPSYPKQTTLAFKTPRCSATSCRCRPLDSNDNQTEEEIPTGHKRFELRLPRTTSALWVEVVGKGVYHKPAEQMAEACLYVDLPKSKTARFVMHSERADPEIGLQTGLKVFEYGPKEGPHWYRVFEFTCGGMNRCTKTGMAAWVAFQRGLPRGIFNPCGSVKITDVSVTGTRERKTDVDYTDMTVRFAFDVYEFDTYKNPGSAECGTAAASK